MLAAKRGTGSGPAMRCTQQQLCRVCTNSITGILQNSEHCAHTSPPGSRVSPSCSSSLPDEALLTTAAEAMEKR